MSSRCLLCATPIGLGDPVHPRCSRAFYGTPTPPVLEIHLADIKEFAAHTVFSRVAMTGVQKKLSVGIEKQGKEARLTIVGLWGKYILKPPVEEYPYLPENEDAVMRLASLFGIPVVPHGMIGFASGELAFISRRIDRDDGGKKLAMEDFCQLSERLTEDKYKGSVERIGKLVRRFSAYPGYDAVDFFERVIFSFITGNSDMHLKNYSLVETPEGMRLAPAYDLVATAIAIPDDREESALTINGKKLKLEKTDFDALGAYLEIPHQVIEKIYAKAVHRQSAMTALIEECRLTLPHRRNLINLMNTRMMLFENGQT